MKFRSNIEKLKILTESLIDRDYLRSKAISLFDTFCSDFPIPMDAWIVDEDLNIVTKKGCKTKSCKNISSVFSGNARDRNIEMHNRALNGETVTYTIESENSVFLTKLIPSNSSPSLVFGISMDITVFSKSIDAIDNHCDENISCDKVNFVRDTDLYKIIKKESSHG